MKAERRYDSSAAVSIVTNHPPDAAHEVLAVARLVFVDIN
jgi:hypothetical protein